MKHTVKQRLIEFLAYNKMSQGAFEKRCGLSNGFVNNIRRSISENKLQLIALQFPELNKSWLLFGEGEMIINLVSEPSPAYEVLQPGMDISQYLIEKDRKISELYEEIAELKVKLERKNIHVKQEDDAGCAAVNPTGSD